jgi:hypothetical protein
MPMTPFKWPPYNERLQNEWETHNMLNFRILFVKYYHGLKT